MKLKYNVTENDTGKTVKQIIDREFAVSSRLLSKMKNSGGISVNGKNVTVRYVLSAGERLTLESNESGTTGIEPVDIRLDILYEDDDVLAVNKPYGMPTHPSQGHRNDTLANAVMYRYGNENFTFRAITRLDGDTTGVLIVARNQLSAQRITDFLRDGKIEKEYFAVTDGVPKKSCGTVIAPIARCEESIIKRKIDENGKYAETHYCTEQICRDGANALLRVKPITGRTHQIRLHLSYIGIPIHGDFLYGTAKEGERALLHCGRLALPHPMTGERLEITAPLPEDMTLFL